MPFQRFHDIIRTKVVVPIMMRTCVNSNFLLNICHRIYFFLRLIWLAVMCWLCKLRILAISDSLSNWRKRKSETNNSHFPYFLPSSFYLPNIYPSMTNHVSFTVAIEHTIIYNIAYGVSCIVEKETQSVTRNDFASNAVDVAKCNL